MTNQGAQKLGPLSQDQTTLQWNLCSHTLADQIKATVLETISFLGSFPFSTLQVSFESTPLKHYVHKQPLVQTLLLGSQRQWMVSWSQSEEPMPCLGVWVKTLLFLFWQANSLDVYKSRRASCQNTGNCCPSKRDLLVFGTHLTAMHLLRGWICGQMPLDYDNTNVQNTLQNKAPTHTIMRISQKTTLCKIFNLLNATGSFHNILFFNQVKSWSV